MRRIVIALVMVAGLIDIASARAGWTVAPPGTEKSKEIKEMDILDRPNRVLHFYGDTVRLANRRREVSGKQ